MPDHYPSFKGESNTDKSFNEFVKDQKCLKEAKLEKKRHRACDKSFSTKAKSTGQNVEDFFNIDTNLNEMEQLKEEKKRQKEFELKVNHLLFRIETGPTGKVQLDEKDPMVLCEVAKRMYGQIKDENDSMIHDLNNYLNNSKKDSRLGYGTTAVDELEICLMNFRPIDVSKDAPNSFLCTEELNSFEKNFNESERGIIKNLNDAQHALVLKAVRIAREYRNNQKDAAQQTVDSNQTIESKITHAWVEGRKKGEADAHQEYQRRNEKSEDVESQLLNEITRHKLEKTMLNEKKIKMEDEINQ